MKRKMLWAIGAVALIAVGITVAQSTGYRFTQNGITFAGTGTVCFEPTYNSGPDLCIDRSGAGHIGILNGSLTANKDVMGSGTSPLTVTFANAYTVAPLCFANDVSGTPAVITYTTNSATTLTLTGTAGHTLNYVCFSNPN